MEIAQAKLSAQERRQKITERVCKLLVDRLGVAPERVTADADIIDDLGADSLDVVELMMAAEEEFQVSINDEDADEWRTAGDVAAWLESRVL